MAATFITKKCSYIIELYKVIKFDANYFWQVELVPLNKLLTYQHGFIVAYCSNMVLKMAANVLIITYYLLSFGTEREECSLNLCKRFSRKTLFNGFG